jgi:hypothetical protein
MSSILQEGSSCYGPAPRGSPSRLAPWKTQSRKLEVRHVRHIAHHVASRCSAWSLTKPLGPHGNPSIIDGSLCCLRIHALMMIAHFRTRGLCEDRGAWRRQVTTRRLSGTIGGMPQDRGWRHHGGSVAQCKPSSSPYKLRGRVI